MLKNFDKKTLALCTLISGGMFMGGCNKAKMEIEVKKEEQQIENCGGGHSVPEDEEFESFDMRSTESKKGYKIRYSLRKINSKYKITRKGNLRIPKSMGVQALGYYDKVKERAINKALEYK